MTGLEKPGYKNTVCNTVFFAFRQLVTGFSGFTIFTEYNGLSSLPIFNIDDISLFFQTSVD